MKKYIFIIILLVFAFTLFGCSINANTIRVVATEKPHAEILNAAKPLLKEKGYKLKVTVIDNYALGNPEVEEGKADANFFQHIPYFNEKNINNKLSNVAGIHIEPIRLYKGKIDEVSKLKDGDKIVIGNNTPDYGRIVSMLSELKLVETVDDFDQVNSYSHPDKAIKSKKVQFTFKIVDSSILATSQKTGKDGELYFINGNYAITGNIPISDSLAEEKIIDNPYINIVVVKTTDVELPKIKALVEVLQSESIKTFITEKYQGSVIPA